MKSIEKTLSKIRTLINEPRKQNLLLKNKITWNILCSSLDTIEDSSYAIDEYLLCTKNVYEIGFSYIIIYGVMQAMFLQQDALKNIAFSLGIDLKFDDELRRIREIRNNSIGHPVRETKGNYKSFNYIQQFGMTQTSFRLVSFYPNKADPTFADIDIPDIIIKQNTRIIEILNSLITFLEDENKRHKEEHMNIRLKDFFDHFGYNISKVYECIHNIEYKQISLINLNEIISNIDKVKSELKKRSILGNIPGVDYNLDEINYPINKLSSYFKNEIDINDQELNIYIFFLQKKIEELIEMFEEIDNSYNQK